ncbi:hypothetical protein [Ligilactobacillus cholophilus]|uniref:hypothetical protein n=1 Tax=Ligilactobacillus cholophilus TaxID=3050131 RepID=UPI0025B269EE|nr:hypothetical protein [Ligilactobacillus cholophilus]
MKEKESARAEIRISKSKVLIYIVLAIFLIILGAVSISAGSGGAALLILVLGVFWGVYCLPYLININRPYLKVTTKEMFYNHAFKHRMISLSNIRKIQVVNENRNIANNKNHCNLKLILSTCLIRVYLRNAIQPIVINPSYIGNANDFASFKLAVQKCKF